MIIALTTRLWRRITPQPKLVAFAFAAVLLGACASDNHSESHSSEIKPQRPEKGPDGTIAYFIEIECSDPGARVEVNNEDVGKTPMNLKVFGDQDGTFHNFGRFDYVITVYPIKQGQHTQSKRFKTGGWFTPEDRIPAKLFFDLNAPPPPSER